mgnify:CR=1 FL=1
MTKKKKSSKKDFIWAIIVLVVFTIIIGFHPQDKKVCFKNTCFKVETVASEKDLSIGLMYRDKLNTDEGMLFLFPDEDRHSFWMKNTYIPLDIIWLNKDKRVVYIKDGAQPCKEEICETFKTDTNALYVLEVNGGKVKEAGLVIGDEVSFNWDLQ